MNDNILSTKFLLAVAVIIAFAVSFWLNLLTADQFTNGVLIALGVYSGTNVAGKLALKQDRLPNGVIGGGEQEAAK